MLATTKRRLTDFLESQKKVILDEWEKMIMESDKDPFKDHIKQNGEAIFDIVKSILTRPEEKIETYIKKLAYVVGDERVKADINIGEFVYNINLGRSIINKYLNKMDMDWTELQKSIDNINYCFDKFLYYTVSYYTEAKNKIIEEKSKFIDSTHKDRLTLLGQMTSSFIHEFRNPLTSIQGFIQLLKADYPSMNYLDIISNELEQLNFRISQFLLLSKKELIGKDKSIFSLKSLIDEVLTFLYPSILDCKVRIINEIVNDIKLYGYSDEIRQVLINIIFNAIDVLSQYRSDPLIEIKGYYTNEKKEYIKLEIANNGPMISKEMLQTIFEPFVTTKKLGTGLGLFVCKEIIEKHKGVLSCKSNEEKTVFTIILPSADTSMKE
ncbi:histidine kinase N-terminal domain-containing protein [Bacillus methanolicus]|uniref:histidine kinase n=1 Tax=Bacillus methanolicus (strain MGA3 / ATCC 53907) TaxID=796606 RepID=I3E7B9_BACMM|nr:histidine kinase N-terminal domain-containing protein [Bacillus methanolicus]AIE59220.1 sensor histidine kinase [Bacillus methanolicus MGA3]EIJ82390.1 sensor histidine kinase [Bacillus methanolicus MGA3]